MSKAQPRTKLATNEPFDTHTCGDKGLDVTEPSQSERFESVLCLF